MMIIVVGPRLIDGRGVLVVFRSFCRGFYSIFCRCRRASGPFFNIVFLLFRFFFVLVNFPSRTSHALGKGFGGVWGGLITFFRVRFTWLRCLDATLWTFLLELHTLLMLRCELSFWNFTRSWCYVVNFLLKKYHDFQWRLHPLKQIVWLHCKMTKKRIFPHLITRWSRFNQWHGCVKDPKWTGMLWPL